MRWFDGSLFSPFYTTTSLRRKPEMVGSLMKRRRQPRRNANLDHTSAEVSHEENTEILAAPSSYQDFAKFT